MRGRRWTRTMAVEASAGALLLLAGILLHGSTIADTAGFVLAVCGGLAVGHAVFGFLEPPEEPPTRRRRR